MAELVIRSARSLDWDGVADILVRDGRIVATGAGLADRAPGAGPAATGAGPVLDAGGGVVIPAFADLHTHLDKALSYPTDPDLWAPGAGGETRLQRAVRQTLALKPAFTDADLRRRARRALRQAVAAGSTRVRTHVDVDLTVGLRGMEAMLALKQEAAAAVDLQLTVLPAQPGWHQGGRAMDLVREALAMGADALGGAPNFAPDPGAYIDTVFALAGRHGVDVDLHVDESDDPACLDLEYLAEKTLAEGYQGRVVAAHCCSLAVAPDPVAGRIIEKVARAGITVVTLPAANLYLMGHRQAGPPHRGVTRIRELLAAGVPVAYASDNVHDPFMPYGRGDLLAVGMITALAAQFGSPAEQAQLLRMGTAVPAAVMDRRRPAAGPDPGAATGLHPGAGTGLHRGAPADLVILDCQEPAAIFAAQPAGRRVIRGGRVVAGTRVSTDLPAWKDG